MFDCFGTKKGENKGLGWFQTSYNNMFQQSCE